VDENPVQTRPTEMRSNISVHGLAEAHRANETIGRVRASSQGCLMEQFEPVLRLG
jgi:hypothetical protein